jgi:S1-C subfamily serine protease
MRHFWFAVTLTAALPLLAQPDPTAIIERAKAATVIVLSGEGAGRLRSISTGVVISKDGTILTALHAVKGALEVQVRLPNGEVFDRVELLGTDERRDVAALKISGGGLATLPAGSGGALAQGAPVYAVTNADGLSWSATSGIVSAIRPADEVPGAGNGFRLIQFTAPVAPGSSGGALVDATGALVGIITRAGGNAAFAVPIESVMGLPESGSRTVLGAGASLQMPVKADPAAQRAGADLAAVDPGRVVKEAHTLFIRSKTSFLTVDTLDRACQRKIESS